VICLIWIIRKRRSASPVALGAAWFFIALAPFSNIIPIDTFIAERYLYSPLAGLALIAGIFVERIFSSLGDRSARTNLARVCTASCVAAMMIFTAHRGYVWSDEYRLWEDAFKKDDRAGLVLTNLGNQIKQRAMPRDPCPLFERSVKYNPDRFEAYVGLGECEVRRGDPREAKRLFIQALNHAPDPKGALEGLSQLFILEGDYEKARQTAGQLLSTNPDSLVGLYVMGYIHVRMGEKEKAAGDLRRVIESSHCTPEMASSAKSLLAYAEKDPGK